MDIIMYLRLSILKALKNLMAEFFGRPGNIRTLMGKPSGLLCSVLQAG